MFAGHVGVALAIGPLERRVNVGVFVASALLLDLALWCFVLLGWEAVSIPADFATAHQPDFTFPYTHSLLAALVWSALAVAVVRVTHSRFAAVSAALVAAAVFSHWLLDALVHRPEMPLAGNDSAKVGLALWNDLPVALAVEGAIVMFGLYLFLAGSRLTRGKSIAVVTLSLVIAGFTAAGMTVAPPPSSAQAMAIGSLVTVVAVCGLYAWLGTPPREAPPRGQGSA